MRRNQAFTPLLVGVLLGLSIVPAAKAIGEHLTAIPSTQIFFVDGRQIELEAYAINGHNYVQLRDVGQVVNFNVCYDASRNAVIMEPDKPYTGEDVGTVISSPNPQLAESTDYAVQANPSIFSNELTPAIYNAVRHTVVNREGIMSGQEPVNMGPNVTRNSSLDNALAGMGKYPIYELAYCNNGYVCNVRYPEAYAEAAAHTQGFVDSLKGLNDGEKVKAICWYVADRITYETVYAGPNKVLIQDSEVPGNCMAYSASFQFLCNRANIPCVLVSSQVHQWTMVYVDEQWWDVDVTAEEATTPEDRDSVRVLTDPSERYGADFTDQDPAATQFAQESLVPGSTK